MNQPKDRQTSVGVFRMLSLVLLVVGMCVQGRSAQLHKFHLEEHVTTKAPETRKAGVAYAAGHLSQIIHNDLAPSIDESNLLLQLKFGEDKVPIGIAIDTGSQALWIRKE